MEALAALPVPETPQVRIGKGKTYWDAAIGTEEAHHGLAPNWKTIAELPAIWERLDGDERKLMTLVIESYVRAHSGDHVYRQTTVAMDVDGTPFKARGRQEVEAGWKAVGPERRKESGKEEQQALPALTDQERATLADAKVEAKRTRPPAYILVADLPTVMKEAWRWVPPGPEQERLREAKGIGTSATRHVVKEGLIAQGMLRKVKSHIRPTDAGMALIDGLTAIDPRLVDPLVTARWEARLDGIMRGEVTLVQMVEEVVATTGELIQGICAGAAGMDQAARERIGGAERAPTAKMVEAARRIATGRKIALPEGCATRYGVCKAFLDEHMGGERGNGGKGGGGGPDRAPSERQIAFAEGIARRTGAKLPASARESAREISDWITRHKSAGEGPSGGTATPRAPSDRQLAYAQSLAKERANDGAGKGPSGRIGAVALDHRDQGGAEGDGLSPGGAHRRSAGSGARRASGAARPGTGGARHGSRREPGRGAPEPQGGDGRIGGARATMDRPGRAGGEIQRGERSMEPDGADTHAGRHGGRWSHRGRRAGARGRAGDGLGADHAARAGGRDAAARANA